MSSLAAPCPYCGTPGISGYEGCRALMDRLTGEAFGNTLYFDSHRLVVDCYMLQHPEIGCLSAKSYLAHLTGLCVAFEYQNQFDVNAIIRQSLDGTVGLLKPPVPTFRGTLTITHLDPLGTVEEHRRRVGEWAASVWQAYAALHETARDYIREVLEGK
jgi:hypothetical protein